MKVKRDCKMEFNDMECGCAFLAQQSCSAAFVVPVSRCELQILSDHLSVQRLQYLLISHVNCKAASFCEHAFNSPNSLALAP